MLFSQLALHLLRCPWINIADKSLTKPNYMYIHVIMNKPPDQPNKTNIREIPNLCFGMHVHRAARIITQVYDEALRPSGLLAKQFSLLGYVKLLGSTPITALADKLFMDQTTLTRNIKLLEKRGLVAINPGSDKRVKVISLTPDGEMALEKALPLWEEAQNQIVEKLGSQRSQELLSVLADTTILSDST